MCLVKRQATTIFRDMQACQKCADRSGDCNKGFRALTQWRIWSRICRKCIQGWKIRGVVRMLRSIMVKEIRRF